MGRGIIAGGVAGAVSRGAKVSFKLSEAASVSVAVKLGSRTRKTITVRLAAGTRTVTISGGKIRTGRISVELRAVDAAGNRSSVLRRSVTIRR